MNKRLVFPMVVLTATVLAACGGGGGTTTTAPQTSSAPSTTVSGTAATGLALSNSAVEIKCVGGTGSTTTNASGAYTLALSGASLPCVIRVTGTADGGTVVLHSVTETGTTAGSTTNATGNVTPLTEMIVAQLMGALPSEMYGSFSDVNTRITQTALNSATTAVVAAIKTGAGIDLGNVDPFKAQLIPATATTPGNAYDNYLESLKAKISLANLPLIVNQLAGAVSGTTNADLPSLASIIAAGDSFLPGCPAARSGKYRTIDYWGRTFVRQIDFKTMKFNRGDGQPLYDITADPQKPCEFKAAGTFEGVQAQLDIVMASSGAGAYRSQNITTGGSVIGYIFPVQAHSYSAVAGTSGTSTWSFLQSGNIPGNPVGHFPGQLAIKADRSVVACDYKAADNWASCVVDPAQLTIADRADGGFNLINGQKIVQLYGYRAPSGTLTVFGTSNPTGSTDPVNTLTSIVASKLQPHALPAVGQVNKYWDLNLARTNGVNATGAIAADSVTVSAVDSANNRFTRTRASDGRQDIMQNNKPVAGVRHRLQGTWNAQSWPDAYQIIIPGTGLIATVNAAPSSSTLHFYAISVLH